jgi:hypothetical protein
MSGVLKQIALAFGAAMFVVSSVIGLANHVPAHVIIFRGIIAMSVGTAVFLGFVSFFQSILYRFVAEQVMKQRGGQTGRPPDPSIRKIAPEVSGGMSGDRVENKK